CLRAACHPRNPGDPQFLNPLPYDPLAAEDNSPTDESARRTAASRRIRRLGPRFSLGPQLLSLAHDSVVLGAFRHLHSSRSGVFGPGPADFCRPAPRPPRRRNLASVAGDWLPGIRILHLVATAHELRASLVRGYRPLLAC